MKKFLAVFLTFLLIFFTFSGCKSDEDKTKITVNEVTHSVFYAPLYIAIEKGYFAEENLEIELVNGGGADNSMTAVLSKSAQIALMGPETVIYVQNQGKKDMPKVFAQLTQRDGSFLVSRTNVENFTWEGLKNKEILAGRRGGVPAMTFEYIMKEQNLLINKDYTLNFDVQFNLMTSAFLEGTADFCTVFEPTASEYEDSGKWKVVASVGEKGGEIPYTSFIALSSYLDDNEETVKSFIKAIEKAMDLLYSESEKSIAETIKKQFPSTDVKYVEKSLISYKKIDAWKRNLFPTENSFDRLQDIMMNAGELQSKASFSNLVETRFLK